MIEDVDRIMAVMATAFDPAFGEAWNRRQVEDALKFGNCHYYLAGPQGTPAAEGEAAVGFSLSRTGFEEEELLLLGVLPVFRRRGIGSSILAQLRLAAAQRGAKRLLLEMRKGNPAEALYKAFGFFPIGERRDYYRTSAGERLDAITFACEI